MKPLLHLVELNQIPILQQLQWEEALLRADQRNWCLINRGSPPAIVMGISGQASQLICSERLQGAPLPVIRRFSGGGTVVVDENTLFVTFICQSASLSFQPFPRPLMQWTAEIYRPLFPAGQFNLQENDYAIGERKWGGNAQSIIKGRWLHHSSLLWDYHPPLMDYLLIPAKAPAYRNKRGHTDFLCRLKDYWTDCKDLQENIVKQLSIHFELVQGNLQKVEEVAALPHRKVTALL